MLEETRFSFYEPKFKGKDQGTSFYSSDIGLGWLSDKTLNNDVLIGAFIHHIAISSKRTIFSNAYYGHATVGGASPWTFAKVLSRFKYYDLMK